MGIRCWMAWMLCGGVLMAAHARAVSNGKGDHGEHCYIHGECCDEILGCDTPLTGPNAVPPVETGHTGEAYVQFLDCGGQYSAQVYHDVPDAASVELRVGAAGENGALVASGTWRESCACWTIWVSFSGQCPWPEDNAEYYFVVTTAEHPDGVLRGQACEPVKCFSDDHCWVCEGEAIGDGDGEGEGAPPSGPHAADQNGDGRIQLSELLRVIQFYNVGGLHCADGEDDTEDGYRPGAGTPLACAPHSADYNPQDWQVSFSELLRAIQIYNSDGYTPCPAGEDGYCVGAAKTAAA